MGTRNVADLFLMRNWRAVSGRGQSVAENPGLVLTISANQLEDDCIEPESLAATTLAHGRSANHHR